MKCLTVLVSTLAAVMSVNSAGAFELSSGAFKNNERLPDKFASLGIPGAENVSPPLSWANAPQGTRSFALTCIDTNPVARNWVHWMVLDIPANIHSLSFDASDNRMPQNCMELKNSFGKYGYGGPMPPPATGIHNYVFTVYALNVEKIDTEKRFLSEKQFLELIKGKTLARARLTGQFSR